MAVVRKSPASTTGNWFRRNSTPSVEKRRSMPLGSILESTSTLADVPLSASAKRQQRSSKKLSVSATKGLPELAKQPVSHLKSQSNTITQKNQKSGEGSLPVMSTSGAAPFWLLRLYTSQRYSSVLTFLLVTATLFLYGWTVYSQELWSQGYNRLQNLQLYERQLTTTNATLKNKMAEEAEQEAAGLVSPTPARTIFLPTASPSNHSDPTRLSTQPNLETQQNSASPLGY
ncbi:MAG TPA: hypothetical protein VE956_19315 [Nodularia sp. (in: cyanobacteria)]|nr:hypothetical protein [Nodularia sp. (in: cyanobacteria)]